MIDREVNDSFETRESLDEQLEHLHKKILFELFDQLNDAEILILQSHVLHQQEAQLFYEKHKDTLYGPSVHLGSTQEEIDKGAIHEAHRRKLTRFRGYLSS